MVHDAKERQPSFERSMLCVSCGSCRALDCSGIASFETSRRTADCPYGATSFDDDGRTGTDPPRRPSTGFQKDHASAYLGESEKLAPGYLAAKSGARPNASRSLLDWCCGNDHLVARSDGIRLGTAISCRSCSGTRDVRCFGLPLLVASYRAMARRTPVASLVNTFVFVRRYSAM